MRPLWMFIKVLIVLYVGCILVGIGLVCFATVVLSPIGMVCFSLAGTITSRMLNRKIDQDVSNAFDCDEWWEIAGLPKPKGY